MAQACVNHPNVLVGVVHCSRCERAFCRNCVVALRGQYYCAGCKLDHVRDIQSGTEAGRLELASVARRFGAMWVDSLLVALVLVPPLVAIVGLDGMFGAGAGRPASPESSFLVTGAWGLFMIAGVVLAIVYEGLMLQSRGRTLGKMAVGIKVVTPEGGDISARQAWGRAVVRQVFFSYCAAVNYLPALFTRERTAVHDLACKTRVVRFRG